MKILIADDHDDTAQLLKMVLEQYAEVSTAADGKEALDTLRQSWENDLPFDLVLLDVLMPNMDGLEALRCIREEEQRRRFIDSQRTKIIMLTAYADEENMQRAFALGCQGYLFKTQGKAKIIERLRALDLID